MSKSGPRADHQATAAACRSNPGVWLPVAEYNSSQSANSAAAAIRKAVVRDVAATSPYTPAGAFDARWILTERGARVEARYVGVQSDDDAWADALADLAGGAA
ncbi:MAG: hypothetical protein LBV78_24275 [Kitasatospora sp.]|jgi:hypothetical protein|nr:hypothetical protein [Kitasatospora sp.]